MKKYKYTLKWLGTFPDENHNCVSIFCLRDNDTYKLYDLEDESHTFENEEEVISYYKHKYNII